MDCPRSFLDEPEVRSRANSGENLRKIRQQKLYHSSSDENKKRSFEKHVRDAQCSRFSLNVPMGRSDCGSDFEMKYFTTTSLDTEESRCDNSDESFHAVEVEGGDVLPEADTLIEEPELEDHLSEMDVECTDDEKETGALESSKRVETIVHIENVIEDWGECKLLRFRNKAWKVLNEVVEWNCQDNNTKCSVCYWFRCHLPLNRVSWIGSSCQCWNTVMYTLSAISLSW